LDDPHGFYPGNDADVEIGGYPQLKAYCYFERGLALDNWVLDDEGGLAAELATLGDSPSFGPCRVRDDRGARQKNDGQFKQRS
jgi:hypothetical protein